MRVVVDTNVLFQGLTQPEGASRRLLDFCFGRDSALQLVICNALQFEYLDVLLRLLSSPRWAVVEPLLNDLLNVATEIDVRFTYRPSSRDSGDEHVIDCAMNARAVLVTYNAKDFRQAEVELGLVVMTPEEVLRLIEKGDH